MMICEASDAVIRTMRLPHLPHSSLHPPSRTEHHNSCTPPPPPQKKPALYTGAIEEEGLCEYARQSQKATKGTQLTDVGKGECVCRWHNEFVDLLKKCRDSLYSPLFDNVSVLTHHPLK